MFLTFLLSIQHQSSGREDVCSATDLCKSKALRISAHSGSLMKVRAAVTKRLKSRVASDEGQASSASRKHYI